MRPENYKGYVKLLCQKLAFIKRVEQICIYHLETDLLLKRDRKSKLLGLSPS